MIRNVYACVLLSAMLVAACDEGEKAWPMHPDMAVKQHDLPRSDSSLYDIFWDLGLSDSGLSDSGLSDSGLSDSGSSPADQSTTQDLGSGCTGAWKKTKGPVSWTLRGVWGSGPTNIFAVGDLGTVLRYDGTTWKAMTSGTKKALHDVWGTGPTEVYAVGASGAVLRFDGTSWKTETSGTYRTLRGGLGQRRAGRGRG